MQNIIIVGRSSSKKSEFLNKIINSNFDYNIYSPLKEIKSPCVVILNSLSEMTSKLTNSLGSSIVIYVDSESDLESLFSRIVNSLNKNRVCICSSQNLLNFGCTCGHIRRNKK